MNDCLSGNTFREHMSESVYNTDISYIPIYNQQMFPGTGYSNLSSQKNMTIRIGTSILHQFLPLIYRQQIVIQIMKVMSIRMAYSLLWKSVLRSLIQQFVIYLSVIEM